MPLNHQPPSTCEVRPRRYLPRSVKSLVPSITVSNRCPILSSSATPRCDLSPAAAASPGLICRRVPSLSPPLVWHGTCLFIPPHQLASPYYTVRPSEVHQDVKTSRINSPMVSQVILVNPLLQTPIRYAVRPSVKMSKAVGSTLQMSRKPSWPILYCKYPFDTAAFKIETQ
ncbi:hypothetical protein B0H11DRAFT_1980389 [Mycena galericulata]|nr:hypothetical protein B0H11DRAFT_1980389 [Mycena galericulata]